MSEEKSRALTRQEFDAVIRRAAELASSEPEGEGSLTEAELFRIAGEVGLSERHIRSALTEVRASPRMGGAMDRVFGPTFLHASREVPGTPEDLYDQLDNFFVATQLLQPVRRGPGMLHYRPAVDWASQIARAASFTSNKYYVASAKSVEVHLEAVHEGRTLVELMVEPGTRGDSVAGAAVGAGFTGLFTGVPLALAVVSSGGALALAIPLAVITGAAAGGSIGMVVGKAHKKKLLDVQSELEGILDRLELGETLEPPPASWRRWVKRQFHGVARDLMKDEREEKESGGRAR